MPARTKESMSAGPVRSCAATPVRMKMPVPMIAPTPRLVSCTGPRMRRRRFSPSSSWRSMPSGFFCRRLLIRLPARPQAGRIPFFARGCGSVAASGGEEAALRRDIHGSLREKTEQMRMKDRFCAENSFGIARIRTKGASGPSQFRSIAALRLESIEECLDHAVARAVMNEEVPPLEVTQPAIHPMRLGVENNDLVLLGRRQLQRNREAELERHVEPNRRADAAHVVNRDAARAHQVVNALQASLAGFAYLENTMGVVVEESNHADEGDEQRLVRTVEWRVDKDRSWVDRPCFTHFARAVFGDDRRFLLSSCCRIFSRNTGIVRSRYSWYLRGSGCLAAISDAVNGSPM